MNEQDRHKLFSELIARHQSALYGYIFAVVRSWEDADDLFQTVCLALWRKFEQFKPDSSFFAWARQMAKLEVSNFMRRRPSSNCFSEELLEALAETPTSPQADGSEQYLLALQQCRQKLPATDESLLQLHYVENLGSQQIARRLDRSQSSVCHSLKRVHAWLSECIHRELARQEHSAKKGS
jgi:RNA polymerase sigma-70 factor (ECF subfamily)